MLEYLEEVSRQPKANNIVNYFIGYADKWISDEVITEVFVDFTVRMRQRESELY